jgi:hypothetical protein
MNFAHKCKEFLANLLAIDEDSEEEHSPATKSLFHDYQNLIESQAPNGSNKVNPNRSRGATVVGITPSSTVATPLAPLESRHTTDAPKEIYYPASLDGLKRQLAAMHERNLALESEVNRLNNEIVSIRERAKKLGAALFESALL